MNDNGYERYSDSDHRDNPDDALYPAPLWARILRVTIRVLLTLTCVTVLGLLAFRLIFAGWYPRVCRRLHMTDALRAEHTAAGTLSPLTQKIAVPYEDRATGFYMTDNLLVVRETGSLQCSLRVNRRNYADVAERAGVAAPTDAEGFLAFSLVYEWTEEDGAVRGRLTYAPTAVLRETHLGYDYYKICFDGVDFDGALFDDPSFDEVETPDSTPWLALEIRVADAGESASPARVLVYENNSEF
ncbi:MAG: hypothetical protein J6125_01780, partial [Clostridia bacterium]|nr:hypothetical protein [Clostridia bacterium]